MRRLTRLQYTNSVNDLLGLSLGLGPSLAEDDRVGAFSSNLLSPVGELHVERYLRVAEAVAEAAVGQLSAILPCDPVAAGEAACAGTFVERIGARAFRRPLSSEEQAQYVGVYTESRAAGGSFADGIRQVLSALLQSPYFLYLVEAPPASAAAPVSAHEAAARLSYYLWNSLPDDTLTALSDTGQLNTPAMMEEQARRLLGTERAKATLGSFHQQWLGLERLLLTGKDVERFPGYSPELAQAMLAETANFADAIIRQGDAKLATLFTLAQSPATGSLLALYGAQAAPNAAGLSPLNPVERAGLLTQASVLAAHSHYAATSPVVTGAFVRTAIMCQSPPPPPPNLVVEVPEAAPGETTRQRFDRHRSDPSCAACHQLMDPIGYGFSNYDAIGAYHTTEAGAAIDASGSIIGSLDIDGPFNGAVELSAKLSTSNQVRECMLGQWFIYALGRHLDPDRDGCSVLGVREAFSASGYDIAELLAAIAGSDSFRLRGQGGTP